MKRRLTAALSVVALSLATIGGWKTGGSIAMQVLESSRASTSAEQTTSPEPRADTWEYKILTGDPMYVGRTTAPVRGALIRINLDEEINRLAVQGYVVESLQAYTSVGGGNHGSDTPFSFSSAATVIVLLKRIRK